MELDEVHYELVCKRCGYVNDNYADVSSVYYERVGAVAYVKKIMHYERNRRYWKNRNKYKMVEKYRKIAFKYGVKPPSFYDFITYWNNRGIPNNIISRDMDKLFLKYVNCQNELF